MSRRAIQFNVSGLFGEFDHQIDFPEADNFAIIHGPNGVGKTRLLEIISALCSLDLSLLEKLPYSEATITYSDSSRIAASRDGDQGTLKLSIVTEGRYEEWHPASVTAFVANAGGSEWVYEPPGMWVDQNDGETISDSEFRSRYGGSGMEEPPQVFTDFTSQHPVHLITTQRLSSTPQPRRRPSFASPYYRRRPGASTVAQYAVDVVDQLRSALTQNSRRSAALDRTFPQRLLQYVEPTSATDEKIRERYSIQNQQRERLARLSLIGSEPDFDLPIQTLEKWQLTVLSLYLDDTEAKLATFDDVLTRVELFEEIVNRRFLRKHMAVNAEEGIKIVTTQSGTSITPEELSSGEQHELIMFYDMLFRVPSGALVLIDEPEISLHVGWQRQFLDDMERVSNVAGTRLIVATHSPQIIGRWWSRTTVIGELEAEDFDQ